jgi:hypothetical protein
LKALVEACRVEDPPQRWALISERLDIDAFLTFVALERMLCHWDGYAQGHNNYRIYFHADDKRACFFPHGMDQILADSNYPVFEGAEGLVARVVLENPTWNEQYRARVEQLLPLFAPEKLRAKIGAGFARIKPAAEKIGADFARELEERAGEFQERIALRQERILHPAPPEPIAFNDEGWAQIEGWEPRCDDDATLEERKRDERDCLAIEVGPSKQTTASFRTTALLAKGSYRLSAKVKTINVAAVVDDRGPGGAGVRISGVPRKNRAIGSADWRTVSHPFQIEEELQAVELIAELRASSGSAYFETDALRIYKVE